MRLIDVDALSEKFIKECAEECAICPMCDGRQYNNPKLLHCKIIIDAPIIDRPQGEWIPCSERLPSKGVAVLVNGIMYDAPPITISTDAPYYYEQGWINAWMPLPKPYREDE